MFARVGRRDLALVISWMREGTKKALIAHEEEQQIIARLHSEENVAEALRLLRQNDEKGDVSLAALGKLIEDASKSRKVTWMLSFALRKDLSRIVVPKEQQRELLSLFVQRLRYAQNQARAWKVYRDAEDQCLWRESTLTLDHLISAAVKFGFSLTPQEITKFKEMCNRGWANDDDKMKHSLNDKKQPSQESLQTTRFKNEIDRADASSYSYSSDNSSYSSDSDSDKIEQRTVTTKAENRGLSLRPLITKRQALEDIYSSDSSSYSSDSDGDKIEQQNVTTKAENRRLSLGPLVTKRQALEDIYSSGSSSYSSDSDSDKIEQHNITTMAQNPGVSLSPLTTKRQAPEASTVEKFPIVKGNSLSTFSSDNFLYTIHFFERDRFLRELLELKRIADQEFESSFQRYASMRSVGGVGELLVLDMTGFRLSCASLNLMWKT